MQVDSSKQRHTANEPTKPELLIDQIERYRARLNEEQAIARDSAIEPEHYNKVANQPILFRGSKIHTFAPFIATLSASRRLTLGQSIFTLLLLALCASAFIHFGESAVTSLLGIVTALYVSDLAFNFWVTVRAVSHTDEERIPNRVVHALYDAPWPLYTILCPLFKEAKIIPQFVEAIKALDYPVDRLQVLLLTEAVDSETRAAIEQLQLPPQFEVVVVPAGEPQTKPRACNYGLMQAQGDYVVIYDAEDAPEALQLKKVVLTFATHGQAIDCVQAKLSFYNTYQNMFTRWFTAEYSLWFDITLPGLQSLGMALPLGGTSNHFRMQTLRDMGGWDPFNVTEDCDLGLRLAHLGRTTRMLDSTTYEEANSRWGNWLRQRSRWIKGYIQTYFVHMRRPWRYLDLRRWREFLSLQLVVGGKVFVLIVNPLMWSLVVIYVAFRSYVEGTYHVLFPSIILYCGAFCLIFGNFTYMYAHLISCAKRGQYRLMMWTFLIPIYWAFMSVAASIAVFQFIFRPFYWEKTRHGFHLAKGAKAISLAGVDDVYVDASDMTIEFNALVDTGSALPPNRAATRILSTSRAIRALTTNRYSRKMPAVSQVAPTSMHYQRWYHDRWLVATLTLAVMASTLAVNFAYQHHLILLWGDTHSHLQIARRFFDNLTPGVAQFGAIWLPLPHVLMEPFIWNDFLWRSGLAGTFVSMPCYVIAVVYVFLIVRQITQDSRASFVGALIFIVNPNMLYIQTTPLSEPLLVATLTAACYYFILWSGHDQMHQLILAAGMTFLASLARYDGWALYLVFLAAIPIIGALKQQARRRIQANLILFGTLGGLGIVLWFLWNIVIFGDPLYFQRSRFSSQAQQNVQIGYGNDQTYHNLFQAVRYYGIVAAETFGPLLLFTGIVAVLIFLYRRKFTPESVAILTLLTPFAFYIVALYTGQAIIWAPGAVPPEATAELYNIRYGVEIIAPFAIFLAILVNHAPRLQVILTCLLIAQTTLTSLSGIVTLEDGEFGVDCFHTTAILPYMARHYDSGFILIDPFYKPIDLTEAGISNGSLISEGIDPYWQRAIKHPEMVVDWVVVKEGDFVYQSLDTTTAEFQSNYYLVAQDKKFHIWLYRRRNLPPLPSRPLPLDLAANPYAECDALS